MTRKETVFVGLSGGVDSSVAALRLQQAGYQVVGVFIKVWHPDWLVCNWEQERLDAMRVAAKLQIPFLTCDAEAAYRDDVAEYFIAEYRAGRTPNPDVMCNKYVKFGRFLAFAEAHGADYIATGHYAQKIAGTEGIELHRGVDNNKDQSYFLWTLTPEQLQKVLFPIGDTPKSVIRSEAERAGLLTATKKDSQGICFLGHIDIKEFLGHYIDLHPGDVYNQDGETIGTHEGALLYTVGQRHGFALTNHNTQRAPHYVVARDIEANTITVAPTRPQLALSTHECLVNVSYITRPLQVGEEVELQNRYRQTPSVATVTEAGAGYLELTLQTTTEEPAFGQSCVLYQGSQCLGGGIIAPCQ